MAASYANAQGDPRASMASIGTRLPRRLYDLIQHLLTWVTGKPLTGQQPALGLTPWGHLASTSLLLILGSLVSGVSWRTGGAWLVFVPVGMSMTLSASRTLWLTDLHAAAHDSFSRTRAVNHLVGDMISLLMLVLPWKGYRQSHTVMHHGVGFTTADRDDDGAFLYWLGLRPGLSKAMLWRRLAWGLVSPRTHLTYLAARLRVNLVGSGVGRGHATVAYLSGLAILGGMIGWDTLAVAWLLPMTALYQASSIAGWSGEHLWFVPKGDDKVAWHRDATHARFMGEHYPADAALAHRLTWWARMLLVHLPSRCLVVPGDLPAHDYHHRYPKRRDWPRAIYARQRAIEAGADFPHETWGLFGAIDRVFSVMSTQPERPGAIADRPGELMLGM